MSRAVSGHDDRDVEHGDWSHATEARAAQRVVERLRRGLRHLMLATVGMVVAGAIVMPLRALWLAAAALMGVAGIRLRNLHRLRQALEHDWRRIGLERIRSSQRWRSTDDGAQFVYVIGGNMPSRFSAWVAGPTAPAPRRRRWSALHADGLDTIELVRGPRRPESWLARRLRTSLWRRRREQATRPGVLHDVPSTPCRVDPTGLVATHGSHGGDPATIFVLIWARGRGTCELWPNGGPRLGHIERDQHCFGLLDHDGRLIVDSEQRFGTQIFGTATGRVGSCHGANLTLPETLLRSRALRSGYVVETNAGECVVRAVPIRRTRKETTVLASVSTAVSPLVRAVALLQACALLELPAPTITG